MKSSWHKRRMILKFIKRLVGILVILIFLALIIAFAKPIWRHLITYPKFDEQIAEFQNKKKEIQNLAHLKTFRGVMHVHSYWSHDSEGTISEIISAATKDGINFIFLSDHPHGNLDTIPRGYHGMYNGVLIEPGSEKMGFNTWPLDSAFIDWSNNKDTISKSIVEMGGLIFYAHTEEPHNWSNPYYQGMEIYNFHTDTKDESLLPHILNFIINGNKYRNWALREMFNEQTPILALWDSLNTTRKIVGFSAIDAHENQNYRARYVNENYVEWIGPDANVIDTVKINFWNRWLFHEPDENGWVFKWMIDTYESGFNYITNYVLSDSLTTKSLGKHLKQGHIYTAFKSLADAKGFLFYSSDKENNVNAILGDSIQIDRINSLKAISPFPGRFRLLKDGELIDSTVDESYEYSFQKEFKKGAYRIEVRIKPGKEWIPWLYSNPIYIY
ncbi:MAG: hypothetical protein L3J11_04735 [Draconibacterium sp.]|nr:hypothetical protein [Draconibacterium sp.]